MLNPPRDQFPIEWDYLQTLADGDPNFAIELLQIFIKDLQTQLPVLKNAIEVQNFKQITATAHYLKGASSNVGAKEMESLMRSLEAQGKSEVLDGAELIYASMAHNFQTLATWVQTATL